MDVKMQALACYESQIEHTDFAHIIRGLNAYRSSTVTPACRYVEAFYAVPLAEHRRLRREFGSMARDS